MSAAKRPKEVKEKLALAGALCFFLGFPIWFVSITGEEAYSCVEVRVIKQIGGCDAEGLCGVEFDDHTFGEFKKPVRGNLVCSKYGFIKNPKAGAIDNWLTTLSNWRHWHL